MGNLKVDLAAKGQGDSRLLEERSELIDDKARLGRQIGELSKRAQRAEAELVTSRATAQALASKNAALEERLAEQAGAHRSLQKRWAGLTAHNAARKHSCDMAVLIPFPQSGHVELCHNPLMCMWTSYLDCQSACVSFNLSAQVR